MKKLVTLFLIISSVCFGQITFETTYSSPHEAIQVVHLSNTLTVYQSFNQSNNQITLFNQNHSIYKSFIIPPQPGTYGFGWAIGGFYSQTLFNSDNLIEYIISNNSPQINFQNNYLIKIYNEGGSILFQKDSIVAGGPSVFSSPAGTKMFMEQITNGSPLTFVKHVYSLPGSLFSKIKEINKADSELNIFPNPTNEFFKVQYKLPSNVNEGLMEIYDLNGKLMKSYRISGQMTDILVDATELASGSYYLKITADNTIITNKLIKL